MARARLAPVKQVDFGTLLEAVPDAVLVADMSSTILYANGAAGRMLGWDSDDLVGRPLHAIQPERLHEAHDRGFHRYATTGVHTLFGVPVRLPARHADGSERDVELNLAEIHDAEGERLVVGVLRDLGERVELERQLDVLRYLQATTAAHARLWTHADPQLVLETLTDVLVQDFDAALARTWIHEPEANRLRMRTSGGLSTRVQGSAREVIDLATYPQKVGVVARTRKPFVRNDLKGDENFDQEWLAQEGIESVAALPLLAGEDLLGVMVAFFRHPIPAEVAEVIGNLAALAAATLNDSQLIEQERAASAAALSARQHFELLARVSERLSTSLNPEVTVQQVADTLVPDFADWCIVDLLSESHALQTVASAHRDPTRLELIAELRRRYPPGGRRTPRHAIYRAIERKRTVFEVVSDDDLAARAVDERHLALLRELGIGSHIVVPLVARGRVMGSVSLIRSPEREPYTADDVATAEDITRRAALATDNALLYRSAQHAVDLRDRFLAVASHELRTPLSVIRGHWELLGRRLDQARADPAAHREQLASSVRRLGHGIEQLQRLVADLLDVNRLQGGQMDLQQAEMDLVTLIRDTVEGLHEATERERVQVDLPESPLLGMWDRARLAQVIANLLRNALKYSPAETPVLVRAIDLGDTARIEIVDSGIGIAREHLDEIFEAFSRAPNAAAQHFPGLGLGLAVSREIVIRHGGRMWAESLGEDQGSTFTVELPRSVVTGLAPEEAS